MLLAGYINAYLWVDTSAGWLLKYIFTRSSTIR